MKKYRYDPILCMNVPDSTSKAKDASWKAWTLYIDGKWVKSFNSSMAPIKEAQKFMKENYPGKVGKLTRNTGSSSGYSISGNEYKDEAPAEMRDAKALDDDKVVGYREISNETRKARVGDIEVYMGDTGSTVVDFTVNWPSIGYVSPDKALSFARDLMKAASNAKKLEQKYKGYKIKF